MNKAGKGEKRKFELNLHEKKKTFPLAGWKVSQLP